MDATSLEASPTLPAPDDRPDADVVIYDGQCRICTAQVRQLARRDRHNRLAFLSLHDPEVARRYPDLSHDELMQNMVVVDRAGRRHRGAEGVRAIARHVKGLWWLVPLLHIPGSMPLWQWCYRKFAANRYRMGGKIECDDGACRRHL